MGLVQKHAMAADELRVAGVELAEPESPRRTPRTPGRRTPVAEPSHLGYPHLNQAVRSRSIPMVIGSLARVGDISCWGKKAGTI